jgi:hypothetical protein
VSFIVKPTGETPQYAVIIQVPAFKSILPISVSPLGMFVKDDFIVPTFKYPNCVEEEGAEPNGLAYTHCLKITICIYASNRSTTIPVRG